MGRREPGTEELTSEEKKLLTRLVDKGVRRIEPRIGPEGLTYAGLDDLAEEYGWSLLGRMLESLADKGLLIVETYDRAIFCPSCGSPHVYSKYTCPRCQSVDVNRMELIEHPFCGYIGEKEKFTSEGSFNCPNCNTDLSSADGKPPGDGSRRDYKVLGSSFECEKCGYRFNKPNVLHICQSCGANFDYRTARYEKIYAYEVPEQVLEIIGRVPQKATIIKPIEAALRAKGYKVERNVGVQGVSGGEHSFDIVAMKHSALLVVDVSTGGSPNDLVSLLGKKLDVNPDLAVLIDMSGSEEVSALGKVYNIVVLNGKDPDLKRIFTRQLESMNSRAASRMSQTVKLRKKK